MSSAFAGGHFFRLSSEEKSQTAAAEVLAARKRLEPALQQTG
jgi:hypothetical protein